MEEKKTSASFQDACPWPVKVLLYWSTIVVSIRVLAPLGPLPAGALTTVIALLVLKALGTHPDHRRKGR